MTHSNARQVHVLTTAWSRSLCAVAASGLALASSVTQAAVVYVDPDAVLGANNGSNWFNAYRSLQTALTAVGSGDEIRIAASFHRPALTDRSISFVVPDGVSLRGGYAGWGAPDPDANNPVLYSTVLSGDLGLNDGMGLIADNSYHVVRVPSGFAVSLQGVTVRGGNASVEFADEAGAGIDATGATLTVQACVIEDNRAFRTAGGVRGGVLHMTNCIVRRNQTMYPTGNAGGLSAAPGSTFTDCLFELNRAVTAGSAGALAADDVTVDGCTFVGNMAGEDGGAIFGGTLTIADCEFLDNSCGVYGGAISLRGGDSTITDCVFAGNSAGDGGAIYRWPAFAGSVRIERCHFGANVASTGGAVFCAQPMDFVRCDFVGNWTHVNNGYSGGALYIQSTGTVRAVNCRFLGQFSELSAGAVFNGGGFEALNCHFSGNSSNGGGGVIANTANLALVNCTINHNRTVAAMSGGGFATGAVMSSGAAAACFIDNCIAWGNTTAGEFSPTSQLALTGSAVVNNCLIQDWSGALGGTGNSGDDPLLIDPDGADNVFGTSDDDPRIAAASPARDEGDDGALPADDFDLDGDGITGEPASRDLLEQPRVQGDAVDIGAVELSDCPADVSPPGGNGTIDVNDLLTVVTGWGPCPAPPATCGGDIAPPGGNGQVDVNDLLLVITSWGTCP